MILLEVPPTLQPFHKNDLRHRGYRATVVVRSLFEGRFQGGGYSQA